jgi:acetyltransferase-like isoleucine patch superfamily enzyme
VDAAELARKVLLYERKSRYLSENVRPWVRARVKWEFLKRGSYIASPFHGPILPALREGRLVIEESVTILSGCWITAPGGARVRLGRGSFLNLGVFVAAYERVDIGENCMFANGCFITDADHRFEDPCTPIHAQGYNVKGPTIIGDDVWCGVNVAIMGGVTVGEHSVIGANSVVTRDVEPFSVVAGSPARLIRRTGPFEGERDSDERRPPPPAVPAG